MPPVGLVGQQIPLHLDHNPLLDPMRVAHELYRFVAEAEDSIGHWLLLNVGRVLIEAVIVIVDDVDSVIGENDIIDFVVHTHRSLSFILHLNVHQ